MGKLQIRSFLLLFIAAFIWGTAFTAQSVGMDYIGPFTFSAIRSLMGSAVLVPCIGILGKWKHKKELPQKEKKADVIKGGIACGAILFVATNLQQIALMHTSVGKSGFLTALYIVIVPVLGIFIGKKTGKGLFFSVAFALLGLYLLCMKTGEWSLEIGDILLLMCAGVFSVHILAIDYFTQKADGIILSCMQFLVCGVISWAVMLFVEQPSVPAIRAAMIPLLYTGVLSSGVAYTLQIVGQKGINPVIASLILSFESVISAIAGCLVLGQRLSAREAAGCAVMFAAIVLATVQPSD